MPHFFCGLAAPRVRDTFPVRIFLVLVLGALQVFALAPGGARAEDETEWAVQAGLADQSLLLDVCSVDGVIAAAGERGHILLSTDQGRSWTQAAVPTRTTLTAIHFFDASLGWAAGHDGIILRTRDGGLTWERVRFAPEQEQPVLDIWFQNQKQGYAIGAYGLFLVTGDGGDTWTQQQIDDEEWHLNHLAATDSGRLFIAAEAGRIYRSDSSGESWVTLPSPYEGSFFGTLPLEGGSLLLFGLRGRLFRSEDAGLTWQAVQSNTTASLNHGLVLEDGTVLLAGLGGTLLLSRDCGRTFQPRRQKDRQGISALALAADGSVIAVGEFGVRILEL